MWISLWLLACTGTPAPDNDNPDEVAATESSGQASGVGGPGRGPGDGAGKARGKGAPPFRSKGSKGGNAGKGGKGGKAGQHGGGPDQSGAALQDPSGFPTFHDWPAPEGPAITATGAFSAAVRLTEEPGGGYRPQVAVGPDNLVHAVFYERAEAGDLIRHRTSTNGTDWSAPVHVGHDKDRNWGPDIVARADGSLVMVYDHALESFASSGFVTTWTDGSWSEPTPLTKSAPHREMGSGHVADAADEELAYVWIGKKMDPSEHFQARWRWFSDGAWGKVGYFSDGTADAWHTNVERRPDGSVLAGYDIGTGGSETTLYVAEGRDGAFGEPEDLTATGKPGERPHFAFGEALGSEPGPDHITWFHKTDGKPQHIYVRSGSPGAWGAVHEPSAGLGGFHFDPDIAINAAGVRCLIWGWDSGEDAEMVYSLDTGAGWSAPQKLAEIDWGKPGLASIDVDASGAFHVVWNQGIRGENHDYYARLAAPEAG